MILGLGSCVLAVLAVARFPVPETMRATVGVVDVAFSIGAEQVAIAHHRQVDVWTREGRHVRTVYHTSPWRHSVRVTCTCFCRDDDKLVTVGNDGRIVVWRLRDGARLRVIQEPWRRDYLVPLKMSDESDLWELWNGIEETSVGFTCICVSPNGQYVAAGLLDGSVGMWRMKDGELLAHFGNRLADRREIRLEELMRDKSRLRYWRRQLGKTGADGSGSWKHADRIVVFGRQPQREPASQVRVSSHGQVVVCNRRTARSWDLKTRERTAVLDDCWRLALSADGDIAFLKRSTNECVHFDPKTGTSQRVRLAFSGSQLQFHNSEQLQIVSRRGGVFLWSRGSGRVKRVSDGSKSVRAVLAISRSQQFAAVEGKDGGIRIVRLGDE